MEFVPGPGHLMQPAEESSNHSTCSRQHCSDTSHHIEVNAAVLLTGNAYRGTDGELEKSDHVLVILETLLGLRSINISDSAGDAPSANVT